MNPRQTDALAASAALEAASWTRCVVEMENMAAIQTVKQAARTRREVENARVNAATAAGVAAIFRGEASGMSLPSIAVPIHDLAFVVRAETALPLPAHVKRHYDLGIERQRNRARITCGEFVIVARPKTRGSEDHHIWLLTCSPIGRERWLDFSGDVKNEIKAALGSIGAHRDIMKGAGELAAVVRLLHAERGGFRRPGELENEAHEKAAMSKAVFEGARIEDEAAEAAAKIVDGDEETLGNIGL